MNKGQSDEENSENVSNKTSESVNKLDKGTPELDQKKFIKRSEDFLCEHCDKKIMGDGFTNHCPRCLWSKHVDVYPGDRAANCGGMMEPKRVEIKNSEHVIIHHCIKCSYEKPNKIASADNFQEIIAIAQRYSDSQNK